MRIGIVGLAGTGKDTLATMLSELSGLPTVALAKPLHDAAIHIWDKSCLERDQKEQQQLFGRNTFERFYAWHIKFLSQHNKQYGIVTAATLGKLNLVEQIFKDNGKLRETISPREFMQRYGTGFWREICPEIFINLVRDNYQDCIVTDVRFENEAAICDRLIVVKRDGIEPVNNHVSEQFASQFNETQGNFKGVSYYVVENNGTLENLKNNVQKLLTLSEFRL